MNIGLVAHDSKKEINAEFLYCISWNSGKKKISCLQPEQPDV